VLSAGDGANSKVEAAMKLNTLQDLYIHELKDLYSAENQIVKALPKMAKEASAPELRTAFEEHLQQTREHVSRLERIFERMNESPKGSSCDGMKGIISEGEDLMDEDADESVCDAALIGAAQRVEHYEMAAYGSVRTYARQLGYQEDAALLQRTLDEEGATDKKLTSIAESHVNVEATRPAR
jgi:ferritin-like metal-binding protein YciE